MSSKRLKYSAKFKLCVVRFAEQSNNCAASRKFCINEKLVRDWRRQVEKLKCMPKNKCADRGKRCQWPDLEENLVKWIEIQRRSGYIVTRNLIRIKAKAMASEQQISDFQATNSWCTRFLQRRNFVLQQKTKIAQKLPEDLEENITSFHRFVIKRHKETNYELVHIGNMDETPVWLDMPSARTVNARGERTVLVNTTGHEKSRFTVVLLCLFVVTRALTFLPPGYKVNQDGGLFTRSFLWLTSGLLGVPLPQIASGYPKLVSGTIVQFIVQFIDILKLSWCYMIKLNNFVQFDLLSQELSVLRMEQYFSSVNMP